MPLLRHVVLFTFTDATTPAKITQISQELIDMPNQIDAIHSIEWGKAINEGEYTHCLLVMFRSEADLKVYATHPAHTGIGAKYMQHYAKVLEFDYWADIAE